MKRNKFLLISIGVSVGIFLLILGGVSMSAENRTSQYVELVRSAEAKNVYEKNIKHLDQSAFSNSGKIQTYRIDENTIEENPMGGVFVTLIINDNKDYTITIGLMYDSETSKLRSPSTSYSKELDIFLNGVD